MSPNRGSFFFVLNERRNVQMNDIKKIATILVIFIIAIITFALDKDEPNKN